MVANRGGLLLANGFYWLRDQPKGRTSSSTFVGGAKALQEREKGAMGYRNYYSVGHAVATAKVASVL